MKIPFSTAKWTLEEDLVAAVKAGTTDVACLQERLEAMLLDGRRDWNVVPVNRGRSAILFLLRLFGVGAGDEVILPSYLCSSVLEALRKVRACPVLADIDADLNISSRAVERLISSRTKAIVVPHLFGYPAAIDEIAQLAGSSIRVIDDAAQCFGSRLGGKMLGFCGDGGLVVCGPGKALVGPAGAMVIVDARYDIAGRSFPSEPAWLVDLRYRRFVREKVHRREYLRGGRTPIVSRGILGVMNHYLCDDVYALARVDTAVMYQQVLTNRLSMQELRRRNFNLFFEQMPQGQVLKPLRGEAAPVRLPVMCATGGEREALIECLYRNGIEMHRPYTPIHKTYLKGRNGKWDLSYTDHVWDKLLVLPLDESAEKTQYLIDVVRRFYQGCSR